MSTDTNNSDGKSLSSVKKFSRMEMLKGAAALSATMAAGLTLSSCSSSSGPLQATRNGRIKQDLVTWTFMDFGNQWTLDELCQAAIQLGCSGVELMGPEQWETVHRYGLVCPMATNGMPDPPYERGLNNPRYQPEVIRRTTERIVQCAEAGVPNVITFTGFSKEDLDDPNSGEISLEEGAANTVAGLKELALVAEEHGVTVCLEHLNSRVTGDDFRGHPGYQGDDIDYCADIIRQVGSPRVKLLMDIYHVQIMNGDIVSRIREFGTDLIGHVHTAGVPGRGELDDSQELNYKAVMEALLEIGYEGYVGQEFIPTRDAMEGLQQAVTLCDV